MLTATLDFHKGQVLLKLANTYPTLREAAEEAVQNSLDAGARLIQIKINYKSRDCWVRDNGNGATSEFFRKALASVGRGLKPKDKYGRFGLGFISPLGKCRKLTFASCPFPDTENYTEWVLETDKIKVQEENVEIPERKRADLVFSPSGGSVRGKATVWWRSEAHIEGFTRDKFMSEVTLEGLGQSILEKYNDVILKRNVSIQIVITDEKGNETEKKVKATSFMGKPLAEVAMQDDDAGKIVFKMFITRKRDRFDRKRSINIKFGELNNPFAFSFANFTRTRAAEWIDADAMDALRSGIFEGEVRAEKVELVPERTRFKENDASYALCEAINRWFKQTGSKYLEEEKEQRSAARYQQLGIKSLMVLEKLLKMVEHADLLKALKSIFKLGTTGTHHTASGNGKKDKGKQDEPSLAVQGGVGTKKSKKKNGSQGPSEPEEENQEKFHLSVQGPKGRIRKIVKSSSLGLQLAYEDIPGSPDLWQLDNVQGILILNTTHPLWVECDKKDWMICALQEHVIIQALTLETMSDDWKPCQRLFSDECTKYFVELLVLGSAISKGVAKKQ